MIEDLKAGKIVRIVYKNIILKDYDCSTGEIITIDSDGNNKTYNIEELVKMGGLFCTYREKENEIQTPTIVNSFMNYVITTHNKTSSEKWTYGATNERLDVEGTLNQSNKQMQCGTLVSTSLVLCGYLTEDDLRETEGSEAIQWNSPARIRNALIEKIQN